MKTLDEVIKALRCTNPETDQKQKAAEDVLWKISSEMNPALTWDELRTMEGKPVWVEFLNDEGKWNGEWCLIESSNDILCEILRCKMSWWGLRKITLGKTWQAYRKERNDNRGKEFSL